jgi:hypothetical protein
LWHKHYTGMHGGTAPCFEVSGLSHHLQDALSDKLHTKLGCPPKLLRWEPALTAAITAAPASVGLHLPVADRWLLPIGSWLATLSIKGSTCPPKPLMA